MKTAVVILNWNGQKMLEKFLPSLIANTNSDNACIIVADNNSSDDSLNYLLNNFPHIEKIELEKNFGFAEGYNRALQQINAEYFVLLNSDVEVTASWLEPLISFMDSNADVAACMPKILSYNQNTKFEYAGASGGFIDKYGYPFCRGRILSNVETDEKQYDEATETFWATGACMVVRSSVYRQLGGLDADFFAHMEEIDFCWRAKHFGYKIFCCPQSTVYHLGGGTLKYNSPQKIYLNYRNNLFMLYKNLPQNFLELTIKKRLLLDNISSIIYLLTLKISFFKAVRKAHCDFKKALPQLQLKRNEITAKSKVENVSKIYQKSIVWQFFKSRKKLHFSDLKF